MICKYIKFKKLVNSNSKLKIKINLKKIKMEKKFKILLYGGSYDGTPKEGAEFMHQLISGFNKQGVETLLITYFNEQRLLLKEKGLNCIYIPSEKEKFIVRDTQKELRELEIKYDFCAERILLGDLDYSNSVSRKKAFVDLVKYFKFWEQFLEKEKPDAIFGGDNRFGNLVPFYISKKKNINFNIIYWNPMIDNAISISTNKIGILSELEEMWDKNKNKELTKEEREKAKKYVQQFRENKEKDLLIITKPTINFQKIKYALERIYASLFIEKRDTPYLRPWRGIKSYFLMFIRARISKFYSEKPKKGEKFIYFPLHFHLETVLLISHPHFFHQERLVEIISQNLPAGHKVYVKSHPGHLGVHELSLFRAIKKLPNVRLINANTNSRKLIKSSSAVAVIAGTAGWEATLLKKPVISFGSSYYDFSGLTFIVIDLNNADRIINQAVINTQFNDEILYKFVNTIKKTIYPGKESFTALYHSNKSNREELLNEKNIKQLVDSLISHLKKQTTKRMVNS